MRTVLTLVFLLSLAAAQAQEPAPPAARPATAPVAPPPDQLEPAVDTGASTASPAPGPAPAHAAGAAANAAPSPNKTEAPAGASATGKPAAAQAKGPKGTDRVELETTDITGNRELPKVLYIVPWKRSDLGDLVGKPANSLLDQVLEPIDREVFLRENRYYDALKPDAPGPRAGAVQGSSDKP